MVQGFYEGLAQAREAELLVAEVFSSLTKDYKFENVGDVREYFYKGDIKATAADGREIFIEVKDDSVIHKTHNVLCEEEVYYKDTDYYGKGNMFSEYNIYTVVSKAERKIYVIDFEVLKSIYHKGEYKIIEHPAQITYCYLLDLCKVKQFGGLIAMLDY